MHAFADGALGEPTECHQSSCRIYAEFQEPVYAPPPLLRRMVEAGLLGRKSGRGFRAYGRD
ncbi:3-hydroxyacyl-CoA dehydrogenase family protein [Streptomyces sp. NPDC039016]|uniref:3-hydroxyacyl-CoA dehydrogenase family protein n=1 Tax=Streptomyces sp. NPDC039016 TaxID=3154330 RepID=UPI0027E4AC28|nr:3-hydroxyacyl-CoA dehydrogenase family protein [Streptomyces sp. CB02959]